MLVLKKINMNHLMGKSKLFFFLRKKNQWNEYKYNWLWNLKI